MSDAFSSIKYYSSPIAAAAWASDLTPKEMEQTADSLFILRKHRELSNLPVNEARKTFEKLDDSLQSEIKQVFGDSEYVSTENSSWFSNAKYAIKDVVSEGLEGLSKYGQAITQPYRAARVASMTGESIFSSKTWSAAKEGEKLFDDKRLRKVREFYDLQTFDVAFKLSTGSTVGEIVANAKTDAELDAVMRLLNGDNKIAEALKDVSAAKISVGRDLFYSLFDVDPGEFGANRKGFNFLSGSIDLATQIAFDPLTYVAPWMKAIQVSRRGVLKFMLDDPSGRLRTEGLALPQERLQDMVMSGGVKKAFDRIGADLEIIAKGSVDQAGAARLRVMQEFQEFNPAVIDEVADSLKESGKFNAEGFAEYFDNWDKLDKVILGRAGQTERLLPSYGAIRNAAGKFSAVLRKDIPDDQADALINADIDRVMLGEGTERKLRLGFVEKVKYYSERALLDQKITVTGNKALGEGKKVYALGRMANFDRKSSGILVERWTRATKGERVAMLEGLHRTIAKNMGIDEFDDVERTIKFIADEAYGAGIRVTPENSELLSKILGAETVGKYIQSGDLLRPDLLEDQTRKAVAVFQLADQITLPNMGRWQQLTYGLEGKKNLLFKLAGGATYGKSVEVVTNAWAWATLIPRLGIRSAIDEIAMYGLAHPATGLKDYFLGRGVSKVVRKSRAAVKGARTGKVERGFTSDLGIVMGVVSRNLGDYVSEADRAILAKSNDPDDFERIFNNALLKVQANTLGLSKLTGDKTDEATRLFLEVLPTNMHLQDALNTKVGSVNYMQAGVSRTSTESSVQIFDSPNAKTSAGKVQKVDGGYKDFSVDELANGEARGLLTYDSYTQGYLVTLNNIFNTSMDGKLASIAADNISDPEKAIRLITELLEKNPKLVESFAASSGKTEPAGVIANRIFLNVFGLTARNADGTTNTKILDLMRQEDGRYLATKLTIDDIKTLNIGDLPASIAVPNTIIVPRNTSEIIAQTVIDGSYAWMERQIATLAREPIFFANYMRYYKNLDPNRKAIVKNLMDNGLSKEAAEKQAQIATANLAQREAFNRTIAFVDNPNQRTNLAFNVRNFARFYRSLEDFYRRAGRLAKYEPLAFRNLRLANEGLDHAGFIYEDDEGDRYFMFPGDQIVFNTLAPVMSILTGTEIKTPMPLQFTGKIKMLSPSFDPEAAVPSLSGPMAGISATAIKTIFRASTNITGNQDFANFGDELSGLTLGKYAEGKKLQQVLLPPAVQRILAITDSDDRDSQWASATRKAMAYYIANGMADEITGPNATPGRIEEFKDSVQATARNIIVMRFFAGLLSPVAPQLSEGVDVPDYLRKQGVVNFKAAFYDMLNEYGTDPNGYEKALRKWTRVNPGRLAYVVNETEANKVASVKKTKQAADFYIGNKAMFKKYPEGAGFFLPFDGQYDINAYRYLKAEGFTKAKPVEDFLKEVFVAEEKQKYDEQKKYYENLSLNAGSPQSRTMINREAAAWREQYLKENPLLKEVITTFQGSEARREMVIKELNEMIKDPRVPNNRLKKTYEQLLLSYYRNVNLLEIFPGQTDSEIEYRNSLRGKAFAELEQIAAGIPEAEMAIKVLFRPSIFNS
jgi:hypothetical protein